MEDSKQKSELAHNWNFFLRLTLILLIMWKFPMRIALRESLADSVFYGAISVFCIARAFQIYRRYGKSGYLLIIVALLCLLLSGWQVVDMAILRLEGTPAHTFAALSNPFEPPHYGWAWYGLRFPDDTIMCHSLFERYFGNNFIAIAYDIDRSASWFACGG